MFAQLYNTPTCFVTDPSILPRVNVAHYKNDQSLAETVKALLYDRIGEEVFNAEYHYCSLNDAKERAQAWMVECNNLTYLFLDNENEINAFRKWAEKELNTPFVTTLDRKTIEIKKNAGFDCSFYLRTDDLATLVVCSEPSLQHWHLMQGFFYLCFKPLFVAKPLTDAEKRLIKSTASNSMARYANAAKALADRDDLNTLKLKKSLATVRKRIYDNMIERSKEVLRKAEDQIMSLQSQYAVLLDEIESENVRLEGAKALSERCEDNDELFNYFQNSSQIVDVEAAAGCISFIVKTYLDVYDPELYREYAQAGYIFDNYSNLAYSKEEHKLLMDAIFSEDPEFHIKMCGYYCLCLNGRVQTSSNYLYPNKLNDYVPNPHLDRHSCLGSYEPEINKLIRSGNIVGAIEQCIASCMSVNLAEVTMTFKPMMNGIFSSTEKVLLRSDGTEMTVKDAIKYLKEKEPSV